MLCDECRETRGKNPRKVGFTADTSVEEIAEYLLAQVRVAEPKVTRLMQKVVNDLGGELRGLDHRIKSRDSLVRKLYNRAETRLSFGDALAAAVRDVLRYTMVFPEELYAVQTQMALTLLAGEGYVASEVENYWVHQDDYQGINTNLRVPGTDIVMELQFHTDKSHRVKEEEVHRLYEKFRTMPDGSGVKRLLFDVMTKFVSAVPVPPGVGGVGSPALHAAPAGTALWPASTVPLPQWLRAARLVSWGVAQGLRSTAARDDIPLATPSEAKAQGWHIASEDYPELAEILWERPDLVHSQTSDPFTRVSLSKMAVSDDMTNSLKDPKQPWWWRKVVGPAIVRVDENMPNGYRLDDETRIPAIQWCRFRRDGHCYFPKELDEKGSEEAGYAVWTPTDRGKCMRISHELQKECPMGEPGPDSGEETVFPDATIPWSQGGQRQQRYSSIDAEGLSVEAAWNDVRAKSKQIQRSGGVRIIANNGMSVTAEVRGESGIYVSSITRVPGTKQVAISTCSCPWETYRWARSGRWKRLEGRMCSHVTALLYEMQSREFGGGEIGEDEGIPIWRTTKPIEEAERQRPGEWRLDRAASLDLGRAMSSHLDNLAVTVQALHSDRTRPRAQRDALVSLANIALDSARVDADALGRGIGLLPGVVSSIHEAALVEPFWAKVNGQQVVIVDVEDGTAVDKGGQTIPARSVFYPTWHPSLGLTAAKADESLVPRTAAGTGVTIALSPSVEMSQRLADLAAGAGFTAETPSNIHLTVAYLGKTGDVDLETVLAAIRPVAAAMSPIEGTIQGLGTFANEGENVLWATPSIPVLTDLRVAVVESLRSKGIEIDTSRGFMPHITLAYSDEPITTLPDISGLTGSTLLFTTLVVAYGGFWSHLDLVGSSGETVAVEKVAAIEEVSGDEDFDYAGVIVRAEDSGRVLMTQRTPFHEDDEGAYGKWEFPGGHVDDGETPLDGALREFSEETGLALPPEAQVVGVIPTGEYGNFVVDVPHESWTTDAELLTHETMGIGWFDPEHVDGAEFVRKEVTDGGALDDIVAESILTEGAMWVTVDGKSQPVREEMVRETDDLWLYEMYLGDSTSPWKWSVVGFWDDKNIGSTVEFDSREAAEEFFGKRQSSRTSVLHEDPEPALPETYGADGPPPDPSDGDVGPGDPRLAWLMGSGTAPAAGRGVQDFDIAAGARAFLAKEAVKTFSAAEQSEIIDEGEEDGVGASNLDRLQIEGTFYASLDDTSTDDDADFNDLMWV